VPEAPESRSYEQTGAAKYKTAADAYRAQLNSHPRTAQGQFWHKKSYPNQGWLDGIYMGDVFYAEYTRQLQPTNVTAWSAHLSSRHDAQANRPVP
jgi:rhamnogalacturonyl hydrolase YesR